MSIEAWLEGPLEGVDRYLMPVAQSLVQVGRDLPGNAEGLVREARAAVERALAQVRATPREALLEPRCVGRRQLPSNVLGLLHHAAEHAVRHTGQALTTAKIAGGAA